MVPESLTLLGTTIALDVALIMSEWTVMAEIIFPAELPLLTFMTPMGSTNFSFSVR